MPYRKPAVVSLNPTLAKVRPQVKSFLSRSQLLAANTRERMSLPQDTNGADGGILGTGVNWASGSGRAMVSPAMINLRVPAPAVSCAHACAGCPRSAARRQCLFSVHHVTPAKSCNFATVGADPHADVPGRTDIIMEPTCAPASLADCRSLHAVISRGSANHKKNRMQRGIRWLFPFTLRHIERCLSSCQRFVVITTRFHFTVDQRGKRPGLLKNAPLVAGSGWGRNDTPTHSDPVSHGMAFQEKPTRPTACGPCIWDRLSSYSLHEIIGTASVVSQLKRAKAGKSA
jgi:hypothetical protein